MVRRKDMSLNFAAVSARPGCEPGQELVPRQQGLGLEPVRDTLLYVPSGLQPRQPVPLILLLHGTGGEAAGGLSLLSAFAETHKIVLAAPSSRGSIWDGVGGAFGPDVHMINRALERIFTLVLVDPGRIAVAGFSDGASYALALGLANGDLFSRVIAFSPGFVPPVPHSGRPRFFVSHGDGDTVLPIDRTSRRLVPALQANGCDVTYREFRGPHTIPAGIGQEAVDWLRWQN
ncbi:putative esterase [Arthrobacter sp. SLBN-100]|nr:putative esterase [Arthrobacter sp. SLBN-100]